MADGQSHDPRAYPAFAVAVDVAAFTVVGDQLRVLLVNRGEAPHRGQWALPGGFVRPDEGLAAAARRELAEEANVDLSPTHVEQLASYGDPQRDPRQRVVSVAHLALLDEEPPARGGGDAAAARWHDVASLAVADPDSGDLLGDEPLAFDHAEILSDAVARLRNKLEYTTLAAALLDEPFTLGDLRVVYEAVWGTALDATVFRRNVQRTDGMVTPDPAGGEGRYRRGAAGLLHPPLLRPANLEAQGW